MEKVKNEKLKKGELTDLRKKKESLTFGELQLVLSACVKLEDLALIKLAVTTAIRREDLHNIKLMNIDLERRIINFWEEKKDRPWTVALEPDVVQTLRMYISTIPKGQEFLFDFTGRTGYNRFQKLLKKAGITKHLEFHALRRTFIRLSRRMGRDIRFVMDQTGDTARTLLEEYEGYTTDEMVELLAEDGIIARAKGKTEDVKDQAPDKIPPISPRF